MAEAEVGGGREFIEGWIKDGKSIESLNTLKKLRDAASIVKQEEVKTNAQLTKAQQDLQVIQQKLNQTNDDLIRERQTKDDKNKDLKYTLSGDRQKQLQTTTREAIDDFLAHRPADPAAECAVDVHFFPGEEGRSGSLFVGGEGAGSHDAKFKVQLNEQVKDLSDQAAKYWGLNSSQVFFLDRDGRIVPDDMRLCDIILPPVPQESPSGSGAYAGDHALAIISEEDAADDERRGMKSFVVKGKDYGLTLVRASTVLDKEDLEKPKGEQPLDFTFDAVALNQDLENTRKKRGDEYVQVQAANLADIPSLHSLIMKGKEKKSKRYFDTFKRCTEFSIFIVYYVLFWILLAARDDVALKEHRVIDSTIYKFTTMLPGENRRPEMMSFYNMSDLVDYEDWLRGPFQRVLSSGELRDAEIHTLAVAARIYEAGGEEVTGFNYCGSGVDVNKTLTTFTVTSTSSTVSSSTSTSTSTSTFTSTSSTSTSETLNVEGTFTTPATTATPFVGTGCVDPQLKRCKNGRVVSILNSVMQLGYQVPPCVPLYTKQVYGEFVSAGTAPFSWAHGKVNLYAGGREEIINTSALSDPAQYDRFAPAEDGVNPPAINFMVFLLNPAMNTVLILKLLTEFTPAASVLPTATFSTMRLHIVEWWEHLMYAVIFIAACVCLFLEMARVVQNPFNSSEEKEGATKWTFVFFLTPLLVALSYGLYEFRGVDSDWEAIGKMMSTDLTLRKEGIDMLWTYAELDYYTHLLDVGILLLLNILLTRYVLVFFPQLQYVTNMVRNLLPTLMVAVFIVLMAFFLLSMWPYAMFSATTITHKSVTEAFLESVRSGTGRQEEWIELYDEYPILWTIATVLWFVIFTLLLDNLPIAILVSHMKEKSLRQNYSYHYWWGQEKTKSGLSQHELNPARLGWDFSGKKPKEVVDRSRPKTA